MVTATFEYEGNNGLLTLVTHFGHTALIRCEKSNDESFRLGGTAINDVCIYEGIILSLDGPQSIFKAFRNPENTFDGIGWLSPEQWDISDLHCYVTESYSLDMEGKSPQWMITKMPLKDSNHLFVNVDILDGGGNVVRRYRASPFTGEHKCLTL